MHRFSCRCIRALRRRQHWRCRVSESAFSACKTMQLLHASLFILVNVQKIFSFEAKKSPSDGRDVQELCSVSERGAVSPQRLFFPPRSRRWRRRGRFRLRRAGNDLNDALMRLERAGVLLIDNQVINNLHHLGLAMSGLSGDLAEDHRSDKKISRFCFY